MEYENICIDVETAFSLENDHSINPCSIQDFVSSDVDFENFLDMDANLMDFDFLEKDCAANLVNAQEISPVPILEIEEKVEFLDQENSHLKGIQDELMEDSSLTDLLLMGAEAVEAGNVHFASMVAMRLNDILSDQENGDNPHDRLAFYFTQGLLYKSLNASDQLLEDTVSSSRQTTAISAFQILLELSPYVKFAHFTANQAILEATEGQQEIHVIDFDIMEGVQWPSLMVDLAAREDASLRITAIVAEKRSWGNIQQTGFRLQEFADSINLPFFFDQILIKKEEDFDRIQLQVGRTLIANCMMNQLHMPRRGDSLVKIFFNGLIKLSPKLVVLVEEELFSFCKAPPMSFVEFFGEAMDHYTAISDSLLGGLSEGYKLALRVIEKEFLSVRILDSVKQFPCGKEKRNLWKENCPSMDGFRPIPMSSCNVTQAKHLVSLFNGGYWVQNEQRRLALWWKSRPLTTASIWVPTTRSNSTEIVSLRSLATSTSF